MTKKNITKKAQEQDTTVEKTEVVEAPNAETNTETTETETTETKPETKKLSRASLFQKFAKAGTKDRAELRDKIVVAIETQNEGKFLNKKGEVILKEKAVQNVSQQISAMLRDIKQERKGWWAKYTIVENETELKIVPKE